MNFIETRGNDDIKPLEVPFSEAILNPSTSFGGLYVPKSLPKLEENFILNHINSSYKELAFDILKALASTLTSVYASISDLMINLISFAGVHVVTSPLPPLKE